MAGLLLAGQMWFNRKVASSYVGYLDLGNTKKFSIKSESDSKIRISTNPDSYGAALDSVNIPKPTAMSISTDEFNPEVMTLLFRGVMSIVAQTSGSNVTETFTATVGLYKRLGNGNLQTGVVVKHGAGVTAADWVATAAKTVGAYCIPTVANGHYYRCTVAGTTGASEPSWPTNGGDVVDGTATWVDKGLITLASSEYTINYSIGMIQPLAGTTVVDGETLSVTYSHNAVNGKRIAGAAAPPVIGQLLFEGVNLSTQEKVRVEVPEIVLTPSGEVDLASDGFSAMGLEGNPKKLPDQAAPYYVSVIEPE